MPCMRCCRARCVFSPKLGIIIQDFARQLFDQLLADQAILMAGGAVLTLPPPIPVQRSHGFTRPTTRRCAECAPPTVKPLYPQTYFRLAASGLRGKAAADNQSLRLHRSRATVSPTAVSYSFLIRSLRANRTGRAEKHSLHCAPKETSQSTVLIRPLIATPAQGVSRG